MRGAFVALALLALLGWATGAAAVVPHDRASVVDGYVHEWYEPSLVPVGWTGNVTGCVVGTESEASIAATATATNFVRALAGLPPVRFEAAWQPEALAAALIMWAADSLSHYPPRSWPCFTEEGYRGASSSNLAIGAAGARAIGLYMHDDNVPSLGHRLWILDPFAQTFATGSTPHTNALLVTRDRSSTPLGASALIAWPPPGYVPRQLVPTRWNVRLAEAGATFDATQATVTVAIDGTPVAVSGVVRAPDAVLWDVPLPTTAGDVRFTVVVDGVLRDGAPFPIVYTVDEIELEAPSQPGAVTASLDTARMAVDVAFTASTSRGVPVTAYHVELVTKNEVVVASLDVDGAATTATLPYPLSLDDYAYVSVRAVSALGTSGEQFGTVSKPEPPKPPPWNGRQPVSPPALPVVDTREARLVRGGVALAVRCPRRAQVPCEGTIDVRAGRVLLGSRRATAAPGRSRTVRVVLLGRATTRAADRRGRVRAAVVVRGPAGRRATALTVLLAPPTIRGR